MTLKGPSRPTRDDFAAARRAISQPRGGRGRVAGARGGRPIKGLALCAAVAVAGSVAWASAAPGGTGASVTQLKTISARVSGKGATAIVIEASEPAAYVTVQPDPLTVYIDLHNVASATVANRFAVNANSPVAGVLVEASESAGMPLARVRITLAQAVAHRVRADRNTIVIEFDRPAGSAASIASSIYRLRPDGRPAAESAPLDVPRPDAVAALGLSTAAGVAVTAPPVSGNQPNRGPAVALAALQQQAPQAPAAPVPVPPEPPQPPAGGVVPPAAAPAAPAAPLAPAGQVVAPPAQRRFTGNPVSLDFQGADLRAVLRTFSEVSGLNMVIDPAIQGTVDVSLRDVPWDQALDIILRANKLGYVVDGNIVRITPLTVLAEEEIQRRKLAEEQALAGELRVVTKSLSYAKAEEMQALITRSALSARGTVQVDLRTNTLIITDLADRLQTASDLIATLDRAQPQVEIEARIVQTTKTFARALGVQWGFQGSADPSLGNTTNLSFPNSGSLNGRTGATVNGTTTPNAVNLGVPAATSAVGLALGSINGAFNLDVALSAAERTGNVKLLSTPRVTTQNNIAAEIAQGVQIPFQTVSNNTVTVQFKDAALILKVVPQISAAGTVIMNISVDNGSVGEIFNNIPSINTQRANTTVLVNDGQTTVIGGIYATQESSTNDRTPGLGSVPLLKWLFKRDSVTDESHELLIFITPRIIRG